MLITEMKSDGVHVTNKIGIAVAVIYYRNDQWEVEFESRDHHSFNTGLATREAAEYYVLAIYLHQVATGY